MMSFEAWWLDNMDSTLLSGDYTMFSNKENYPMVYKTQLVDMNSDIFLTTFGLEIDHERYKIPMYSSGCYEKIHYEASDYTAISVNTENISYINVPYNSATNNLIGIKPVTDSFIEGQAYPKIGSCGITTTNNAEAGFISPSSFKVANASGDYSYTPLELVFKFNKYREAKPYVPFLDSIDVKGVSY